MKRLLRMRTPPYPWISLVAFMLLLVITATIPACSTPEPAEPPSGANTSPDDVPKGDPVAMHDNLLLFTYVSDFENGHHEGTQVVPVGNGAVALKEGAAVGIYTSPEVETKPFEYLILSWNADTPKGTYIEVEGRVHAGSEGDRKWSSWLSWGTWSSHSFTGPDGRETLPGSAPSSKASDELAKVATDELIVIGTSGETADKFQYRVTLHRPDGQPGAGETGPKVLLVASTIRNTLSGQEIPTAYDEEGPDLTKLDKDLDVPAYSQMIRDPKIANSICSPTSVAMALGYHGVDMSPEQAAWGVNDYRAPMFGNWVFNTAFAGANGFTAYVQYGVPAEGKDPWYAVKQEINQGNPVIVSVKYRKPGYEDRTEPEVENVPINYTAGHLVLIRGFTWKDGREYVIVNDAAAAKDEEVRRLYPADQFFEAWVKKVMYVIHKDESEGAQPCVASPIQGELVAAGSPSGGYQKYELIVDGEPVSLSDANIRSAVVSLNGQKTVPFALRVAVLPDSNLLWFKENSEPGKYTFWFFDVNKNTYQAELEWKK
ncbi:MAG TPA: hypothetical protein GX716_06585 [Firmicutes bacterium]|nr:hypothetical protein [Candidatus Fermentithermobacillaceae bacterium]